MSQAVDRAGVFRGKPIEWSMGETKNGFPQFIVRLALTEFYDESGETPSWIDWSEYEMSTLAYLVLFNAEKALLNYEQVMKAFQWDGASFGELASTDHSERTVLVRIDEDTYNGETKLKVNWVDEADAPPTRTLTQLDAEAMKGLDSRFAGMMKKKLVAPVKAASKPASPTKPAAAAKPAAGKPAAAAAPSTKAATAKPSATKPAATAKPAAKPAGPPKTAKPAATVVAGVTETEATEAATAGLAAEMTQVEAWEAVYSRKPKETGDDEVASAWTDAVIEVAGDRDESDFTPADWTAVCKATLSTLNIPF